MVQTTIQDRRKEDVSPDTRQAELRERTSEAPVIKHADYERSSLQVHTSLTVDATTVASGGNSRIVVGSILVLIVVPFLLACVYYAAIAQSEYISEARFAVRTLGGADVEANHADPSKGNGLFMMSPLAQDAYVVTSFIHSPGILDRLSAKIDFRALFAGSDIDYWVRLESDFSREDLLDYWNDRVATYLDGPSGIVTLKVRAFTADDARMLAQAIIDESEMLANELSLRARADYIRRAEQEVEARRADYKQTLERLNALQNETAILDPGHRASETGTLLTRLMAQKLEIDARLYVFEQQATTDSPTVTQLLLQQSALKNQIEALRSELADSGTAGDNLSNSVRRFSELDTERMLASELYAAARRNLAHAQADAIRKEVYITVFVPPELSEESRYPRRVVMPLLILLGLTAAWGIGALIWASVEDHRT